MANKPILQETPVVRSNQVVSGQPSVSRLDSSEQIADRPIRNHFNGIIFFLLAFMVLVVVLGGLFFHFARPHAGDSGLKNGPHTASSQTQ